MSDWAQFIVERYNYWIFIVLMMTGLYIVIARGNLVKKIVGLNIFQTSVFIFYISIGKVAGGTAPIIIGGHGGGHEGGDESGHAAQNEAAHGDSLHAAPANLPDGAASNDLAAAAAGPASGAHAGADALHAAPSSNMTLAAPEAKAGFDVAEAGAHAAEAAGHAAEIIYSNPLPHVLILTAIVVGVATTAVALAIAVRIREAYGTIEEDELEAADDIAEFGHDFSSPPTVARS